jgi:hypothetical protein
MQLTFEEELTMHTCPSGHERCTCKTLEGWRKSNGPFPPRCCCTKALRGEWARHDGQGEALSVNERVGFLIEALQEGRSSCSWADSGRGKEEVSDSEANCFKPPKLRPANQEKK